jgi:hypothetical protein
VDVRVDLFRDAPAAGAAVAGGEGETGPGDFGRGGAVDRGGEFLGDPFQDFGGVPGEQVGMTQASALETPLEESDGLAGIGEVGPGHGPFLDGRWRDGTEEILGGEKRLGGRVAGGRLGP